MTISDLQNNTLVHIPPFLPRISRTSIDMKPEIQTIHKGQLSFQIFYHSMKFREERNVLWFWKEVPRITKTDLPGKEQGPQTKFVMRRKKQSRREEALLDRVPSGISIHPPIFYKQNNLCLPLCLLHFNPLFLSIFSFYPIKTRSSCRFRHFPWKFPSPFAAFFHL